MNTEQPADTTDLSHLEFDIEACEIEECGKPATHLATPECGHAFLVCKPCAKRLARLMRDGEAGECDECGRTCLMSSVQPIHP
jgi:hypothetical protein